jgi:hypothetical protein
MTKNESDKGTSNRPSAVVVGVDGSAGAKEAVRSLASCSARSVSNASITPHAQSSWCVAKQTAAVHGSRAAASGKSRALA